MSGMAAVQPLSFGTLLRRSRRAVGLTQEELAEQAGLSVRGISDLERGAKHRPHKDTVQLLADTLGLSGEERATFEAAARGVVTVPPDLPSTDFRVFLIADVRGYTRFTLEHGDEAAAKLAAKFASIAREVVLTHSGQVIELRGDEALAIFSSVRGAVRAAVDLQERFSQETMADTTLPLKVGIGLDAGEAIAVEGGYRGAALNLAARLCSLAGPREVLASEAVVHLAQKVEGLTYLERGAVQLKGFADPVRVVQVVPEEAVQIASDEDGSGAESVRESPLPIGGFLGALPSGPLVAREDDLRRVMSAVDAVAGGSGRLVLLAGEPGVGKTRLAQEVTLAVRNRGYLVASGRCYAPHQAVPYYPFLEALATAYAAAPSGIRTNTQHRWPYLARLLPDQLGPPPASSSEGQEEQQRLLRAVTGFVVAIAAEMPVALLLDDLHWADGATLDLLQHLARHTRAHRVLLLGTYRDEDIDRQHSLEQALRDLNREQLLEQIAVRRLGQDGTAALMAASFGETEMSQEFAGLVYCHTEGNPFFTQEVLRALVERGDVYRENGGWSRREITEIEVPDSVRSAIRERVSRLSDSAQAVLHEASVLGQTFVFDDFHAMGDRTESDLEAALEESMVAGLVREMGRDEYSFNHALTQQAMYWELSGRRKRRLHLAAAEALERKNRKERAGELAWHFLQGDDAQRALPWTMVAGDQAVSVFAYDEAERRYQAVLELARELGDAPRQAEALEKLGSALKAVGQYNRALGFLEQAADMHRAFDDPEAEDRVIAQIGRVHFFNNSFDQGIQRLRSFLAGAERSTTQPRVAACYSVLAMFLEHTGQMEEALAAAEQAAKLARMVRDDRILLEADLIRGDCLSELGQINEGIRVIEDLIPVAESVGDLAILQLVWVGLSWAYNTRGELERGHAADQRSLELATRIGEPSRIAYTTARMGWDLLLQGRWDDARSHFERATAILRAEASPWAWYPLVFLAQLCLGDGRWEDASRYAGEVLGIGETIGNPLPLTGASGVLAELDLLDGRPEAALKRLTPLTSAEHIGVSSALPTALIAWAYLEVGDVAQAEETAAKGIEKLTAQNNRLALTDLLRVQGMVLTRLGRWQEAERALAEATHLAHDMAYPYAKARGLHELGLMHAQKGEPRQARDRLNEALAGFQRLGARPYITRTEQALAELG
jgi:class 3 adenylate cyclase/tetratricopeptide (TPR) repeat protein